MPIGEQPLVKQCLQEQPRILVASQSLRSRNGHARQKSGAQQQRPGGRVNYVEDLSREIVERSLERLGGSSGPHRPCGFKVLEHKHETRRPAARAVLKQIEGRLVHAALSHDDVARLVRCQLEVVTAYPANEPVRLGARQRRGWVDATEHEQRNPIARLAKGVTQDLVEWRGGRNFVAVIKNDDGDWRQARKKGAKIAAG